MSSRLRRAAAHVSSAALASTYEAYYRNAASFCTPATYDLTKRMEVAWFP